jgi:hypothetical protein
VTSPDEDPSAEVAESGDPEAAALPTLSPATRPAGVEADLERADL